MTEKGSSLMHRFIILLAAIIIALGIGGCGGGGTSADPLGTDGMMFGHKNDSAGTDWSTAMTVTPRGTVILTAKVKSASGTAVVGREVSFGFVSNTSGATLSSTTARTDTTGEAMTIYTAGIVAGFDVVRASISNGATLDTNITVGSGGAGGIKIALSGSPTSLFAGQNSILTATVTDSSGNLMSGQAVTFAFGTPTTIGSTITTINGLTDSSGRAVAIYTAGATSPTATVQDTVQAGITGSAGVVIITRTASTALPPVGYLVALAADVTSLAAGQSAIVTATVTDGSGNPASGQTVTFALLSNNSGATFKTLNGGSTDASGRAVAVYTTGATAPTSSVQDTFQASVTGATGAIVMTRTASSAAPATGLRMTATATPTSLIAGAMSVIAAQVANADGTPASGITVTFAIVRNNSGAPGLTTLNSGLTDANGTAVATYTAGSNSPGLSVQDAVTAGVTGSTAGAVIITRLPATGTGNRVSLVLNPATTLVTTTSNCIVKATVLSDDGVTPVAGETVTFSIVTGLGTITPPLIVNTNNSGVANAVFTAPGGATGFEAVVRAQILGTTNGGDAVGIIRW
jgi:5-hydroxyisourate hydrolase-like protein (transthyretin family)